MIRINLLPVRAIKKKETIRFQISVFFMSILLCLVICFYVNFTLKREIDNLNYQINASREELVRLKKMIGEVSKFENEQKILKEKINIIDNLEKDRDVSVHLLDELTQIIPQRVWIDSFKQTENTIDIEGVAVDNQTIADFMARMEASQYFKGVELIVTQQVEQKNLKLKKFVIRCQVEVPPRG